MSGSPGSLTPRQHLLLAVAPIIAFALLGVVVLRAIHTVRQTDEAVTRTHDIMRTGDHLLARLVDAETGQRGYIITGDSAYLKPYHGAEEAVHQDIDSLRLLLQNDAVQLARVDSLHSTVVRRFQVLIGRIVLRQAKGFEASRDALVAGGGRELMLQARDIIGAIGSTASDSLAVRARAQQRSINLLTLVTVIGLMLTAFITVVLNRVLSRYAREQQSAREQLEEQAAELEMQQTELEAQQSELEMQNEALEDVAEEAQAANRAKMQFLTAMSHELRTPLNAIIGYSELLSMGIGGPVTPQQTQHLDRIGLSSKYLLTLINDVLSFARVQSGKLTLDIRPVDVDNVFASIDASIRPQAEERGITVTLQHDASGARAMADSDRLQQILLNLIGNGLKYTEPGGLVEVRCNVISDRVIFSVRDTGCGIASDKLEEIFDPFIQLRRNPEFGSQAGVGLGLAISRELARAMDGDISVTSEVGVGSLFTLALPLQRDEIDLSLPDVSASAPVRGNREPAVEA